MPNYFISYSQSNKAFVRKLRRHILSVDSANEVFLDEYNLSIGSELKSRIQQAIQNCDYFILVASEAAIESPWVAFEIEEARKTEEKSGLKKIFVVRVDSVAVTSLPESLSNYLVCDFASETNFCGDFYRLMRSIDSHQIHFDAKVDKQNDSEGGYLFSISIEAEQRFMKQIEFVEYRFDFEFDYKNTYNSERIDGAVHVARDRRSKFGVFDLWTSESIVVFLGIYLRSTEVVYIRKNILFGVPRN